MNYNSGLISLGRKKFSKSPLPFPSLYSCLSGIDISRAYEIPYSGKVPEEMYILCLSLMMSEKLTEENIPEMQKTEELRQAVLKVLERRRGEYETSLEEDERLLRGDLGLRKRMAVEVRIGEKRILGKARGRIEGWDVEPVMKRQKTR
jgi:hypothetical protein